MNDNDYSATPMTKAERTELARIVKMRTKVSYSDLEARRAELLADFEEQLDTHYDGLDERWGAEVKQAVAAAEAANEAIRKAFVEAGVPQQYAPALMTHWLSRGENATKERRAELRRLATTRLDAMVKSGRAAVERTEVQLCTELVSGALVSTEAQQFLARLPNVEALLPPLVLAELAPPAEAGDDEDDD